MDVLSVDTNFKKTVNSLSLKDWQKFVVDYLGQFTSDPETLKTVEYYNPFSNQTDVLNLENASKIVQQNLEKLNVLNQNTEAVFEDLEKYKQVILIYTAGLYILFNKNDEEKLKQAWLEIERLEYCLRLIEELGVSRLSLDLQDHIFIYLEPDLFAKYISLKEHCRINCEKRQGDILKKINNLIEDFEIEAIVETRIKTIFSIHKKVKNKNILPQQVLDSIGLRIVTKTREDCYNFMDAVLVNWTINRSSVKDYIAVPKQNGYQCIHLTIFDGGYPVEIQIRAQEMHSLAEYGSASHRLYKKTNVSL